MMDDSGAVATKTSRLSVELKNYFLAKPAQKVELLLSSPIAPWT